MNQIIMVPSSVSFFVTIVSVTNLSTSKRQHLSSFYPNIFKRQKKIHLDKDREIWFIITSGEQAGNLHCPKSVRVNGSVSCCFDCVLGRVILDEYFCPL
jgi:hypothetical protein